MLSTSCKIGLKRMLRNPIDGIISSGIACANIDPDLCRH